MSAISRDELGRRLAAARAYHRFDQSEVYQTAVRDGIRGLSPTQLSQIEKGQYEPNLEALRWLCGHYDVKMSDLTNPDAKLFGADEAALQMAVNSLMRSVNDLTAKIP